MRQCAVCASCCNHKKNHFSVRHGAGVFPSWGTPNNGATDCFPDDIIDRIDNGVSGHNGATDCFPDDMMQRFQVNQA